MDQIVTNIQNPSWWFTGVFFILLGFLLKFTIFDFAPWLWKKTYNYLPEFLKSISRWRKYQILKTVKSYRQDQVGINWLIGRYWFTATFSFLYLGFVIVYYFIGDVSTETFMDKVFLFLLASPGYVTMVTTIVDKRQLFKVMSAHNDWNKRITNKSI